MAQHTDQSPWEYYISHPEMAKRFAGAMSAMANGIGSSACFLAQGYPGSSIGDGSGKAVVVDVGGSRGNISVALARAAPGLDFVVQDLAEVIQDVRKDISAEVTERIEFMPHDFFMEQPVKADVYLFRNIFHNWSDAHVIKILKATIPALRPGAHVLVNDVLLPEPGTLSWFKERHVWFETPISPAFFYEKLTIRTRNMDMVMLSLFNSSERDEMCWKSLFQKADCRFSSIKAWVPEGATLAIIDAIWEA